MQGRGTIEGEDLGIINIIIITFHLLEFYFEDMGIAKIFTSFKSSNGSSSPKCIKSRYLSCKLEIQLFHQISTYSYSYSQKLIANHFTVNKIKKVNTCNKKYEIIISLHVVPNRI